MSYFSSEIFLDSSDGPIRTPKRSQRTSPYPPPSQPNPNQTVTAQGARRNSLNSQPQTQATNSLITRHVRFGKPTESVPSPARCEFVRRVIHFDESDQLRANSSVPESRQGPFEDLAPRLEFETPRVHFNDTPDIRQFHLDVGNPDSRRAHSVPSTTPVRRASQSSKTQRGASVAVSSGSSPRVQSKASPRTPTSLPRRIGRRLERVEDHDSDDEDEDSEDEESEDEESEDDIEDEDENEDDRERGRSRKTRRGRSRTSSPASTRRSSRSFSRVRNAPDQEEEEERDELESEDEDGGSAAPQQVNVNAIWDIDNTIKLIPKPKGEAGRPGTGGYNLQKELKLGKEKYEEMRKWVKRQTEKTLDCTIPWTEQPDAKLDIVREKAVKKYIILSQFKEVWPVDDLMKATHKYRAGVLARKAREMAIANEATRKAKTRSAKKRTGKGTKKGRV